MSQPHLSGELGGSRRRGRRLAAQRHSGGSSGAVGALEATVLHSGCPGSRFPRLGGGASGRKTLALLSRVETLFGPTQHRHHLSANGAARARAFVSIVIAFGQLAAGEP